MLTHKGRDARSLSTPCARCNVLILQASGFVVPTSTRVAAVSLRGVTMKAGGDLLIIGAGTLGERLTKQYKAQYPTARVVACTNTTKRHDTLRALGAEPTLSVPSTPFPNVAYFVTPNAKNFLELCQQGLHAWQGPGDDGSFLFSSSVGVFAKNVPEGTRISETHATNASASSFSRTLVCFTSRCEGRAVCIYDSPRHADAMTRPKIRVECRGR
ncbi:MAG: hypothetical protein ACPIOQ_78865 [Promethearchaeia archaeon]